MVPDHQVRRKWSGDASKKVQLFKVGGSRIIGTAVKPTCKNMNGKVHQFMVKGNILEGKAQAYEGSRT